MVLEPEHEIDTTTLGAERPFVGRDDCKALFAKALRKKIAEVKADRDKAEPTVLVFHGVAGIGKTELQNRLAEKVEDVKLYTMDAAINFANPTHRQIETALVHLRGTLKEKYQVSFDVFDLAYAVYWKKTHPQIPLNRDSFGLWDETGLLADLIELFGELPGVGLIPKLGQVLAKRRQAFQNWFTERAVPLLQKLPQMEPYQIAELLPAFLALDIKKHMQDEKRDIVVFLDTFEALWETERDDTGRLVKDNWVRELVKQLSQALWVVTGREKLPWADRGPEWEGHIDQHEIQSLDKPDAMKYLTGCGIENEAIREVIFEGSKGVPYYLSLSVDTFIRIRDEQEREPAPGDFGKTFQKIYDSFLRNLNEYERDTLKVLSAARWWDKDLFILLVNKFGTNFPLPRFKAFHSFSFVREGSSHGEWSMHDLMREHLQEYQDKEDRESVHKFLFEHYDKLLEDADVKNITETHKTALPEAFYHATHFMTPGNLSGWVCQKTRVFYDAAQWQLSVTLYESTIAVLEEKADKDDPALATCLNNLALLYKNQGLYDKAEPLYQRALEIGEMRLGQDHPDVASQLNNLAGLYYAQGLYSMAEPLYKRALQILEQTLGGEHPLVASGLNNFALLYKAQGLYDKAEPLYKRALDIGEKTLGSDHPNVATWLNNLAGLYYDQGLYSKAEPLYKRALEIDKKVLGGDHPRCATTLNNFAVLYNAQGLYDKAEPLLKQALEIREAKLGEDHPDVAQSLNNLAELYRAQGLYDKAEPLYQRALEIGENTLGPDHPSVATWLNNLALLYYARGLYSTAEPLYKRALEIDEKALGEDHPAYAADLHNLAILYDSQGFYSKAEPLLKRALEIWESKLGPRHPNVGTALENMADLYQKMGNRNKARECARRAAEIKKLLDR